MLISLNKWMLCRGLRHYSAHYHSRFCKAGRAILATIFVLGLPLTVVHAQANDQDYSKFLHTSSKHASIGCNECHRRTDNSSRPSFPGHKSCTGCHLTQFTTPTLPMCSIC